MNRYIWCFFFCRLILFFFAKSNLKNLEQLAGSLSGTVLKLPRGPLIAKNFCGSILADCFVLTPHNNQLRHCQRNTHRSRFQSSVAAPFTSSVPTVGSSWRVLPPWTPPLLTSGSVVALPAKPRAWSFLLGGLILSQQWKRCAIKGIENSMKGETKHIWPAPPECKIKIIMACSGDSSSFKKKKKKLQSLKNYKGQPAQHLCNGDALMRLHSVPESLFQNRIPMLL